MAEVTVDAPAIAKAPYDPNDIPEAVKQRAKAIEAYYGADGKLNDSGEPSSPPQPPGSTEPAVPASHPTAAPVPQVPTTPEPPAYASAPQAPAVSAPAQAPAPVEDENSETWKHRFLAMQGRHDSSQRTIAEMQDQMTQLGNELLKMQQSYQRRPQQQPQRRPPPAPTFLTEADVQTYGSELVDFAQRAAAHAVAPQLDAVKTQNAELRRQLAVEARRRLDQQVELAVPNYREVDREPRWHRWLLGIDAFTGRVRQQLLNDAISAAEAPRVISFFKGFLAEEAATGHLELAPRSQQAAPPKEPVIPLASLAAPGRPRPATGGETSSVTLEKPVYTRADIKRNYELHRRQAFVGREAEWNRLEHDMIAAGREGRVR